MNWQPTPDELREVERAHFRQAGRRGLTKARRVLAKARETSDNRKDIWV